MLAITKVSSGVGSNQPDQYMLLDSISDAPNIQAIHDILMDYIETDEGRQQFQGRSYVTMLDFASSVPDSFCERRGYRKMLVSTDEIVDGVDGTLATCLDIACHLRRHDREQDRSRRQHNASIEIANLLEEMQQGPDQNLCVCGMSGKMLAITVVNLAEEFVALGNVNLKEFVYRRIAEMSAS